jgi:hypothetical protein
MERPTILTILLASTLAFGQKFEVKDLSASDSPISFTGTTKVLNTGTVCVVTAHNKNTKSLLALESTADVATPYDWDQPTTFTYDGFLLPSVIGATIIGACRVV